MIIGILALSFVLTSINNAFAQTEDESLQDRTLSEVVKQTGSDWSAQIDVGGTPLDIALQIDQDRLYVANSESDSVSVISTVNNTKIGPDIPVGEDPKELAVNPFTNTVYVLNDGSRSLSVIDGKTNEPVINVTTGEPIVIPVEGCADNCGDSMAVNTDNNTLYVLNDFPTNGVSVIDGKTNEPVINVTTGEPIVIPVGNTPREIAINYFTNTLYVSNSDSDTVSVISAHNNTWIKDIRVGEVPGSIAIDVNSDMIYVANSLSDSVSVINGTTNTKMGEDIPVGNSPGEIGLERFIHSVYVVNWGSGYPDSGTVSVISTVNNTKIGPDIPVGQNPEDIDIFRNITTPMEPHTIYVANEGSHTISVINGTTNTKMGEDIPVGGNPIAIDSDDFGGALYVATPLSDGISVIDAAANKVVAGLTFNVNPFNSGYILCDGLTTPSPTEQYVYVSSGTGCTATPNEGFEFVSWEKNLGGNSTQPISVSRPALPWDSFVLTVGAPFGYKPDKPEATLSITEFGTFTANFKELPPAIPSEYWIPLYGIIISTIVGWSIPSIIGWTKSKRDVGKLNYYHKQIASLYDDGKLDENDIDALDRLRSRVVDAYSEGKLNEKHYENLKNEISVCYDKIFRKRIYDAVNDGWQKGTTGKELYKIKSQLEYSYSEGKLSEKHYHLLKEAILNLDSKE